MLHDHMKPAKILLLSFYLLGLGFFVVPQNIFAQADSSMCCVCKYTDYQDVPEEKRLQVKSCDKDLSVDRCTAKNAYIYGGFAQPGAPPQQKIVNCGFELCSVSNLCPGSQPPKAKAKSLKFNPNISIPGSTLFQHSNNKDGGVDVDVTLLQTYIRDLYKFFAGVAGILAVIMIAIGGLLWLFSSGDSGKITKAKEIIIGAIVGLILVLSSYLILNTVNPALVNFKSLNIKTIEKVKSPIASGCCLMTDKKTIAEYRTFFGGLINPNILANWFGNDFLVHDLYIAENMETKADCDEKVGKIIDGYDHWSAYQVLADLNIYLPLVGIAKFPFTVDAVNFNPDGPNGAWYYVVEPSSDLGKSYGTRCTLIPNLAVGNNNNGGQTNSGFEIGEGWDFDDGIEAQLIDAAPDLIELLSCLRINFNKMEEEEGEAGNNISIGRISSISNENHIGNVGVCRAQDRPDDCAHSRTSCHYGGNGNDNESHAVDLGDEDNGVYIETAIENCSQFVGYWAFEPIVDNMPIHEPNERTNHIHISTASCRVQGE